ncbi:sensor histidine kinase [Opitutus terrae]|uniref:histidine kinase n=1 Tax=Opitutus terrae (strain DSM 11246 / JCM 15787 / PB90-1) TaxID=452637 RepID=B1ZSS3_OPITP|nr:HAMP domain-containing sensor histidine kinase [Opitutus terrae]ACB74767.1 integral membrane sensor signal transduction histidine kinase [Opitutus terrae PB90-1]
MKQTLAALWPQLRRSVFPLLPEPHRPGLARHLAYANWLHALLLAPAVTATNVFVGLLPELQYYRSGYWPVDPLHLSLTALHGVMIALGLVAFLLLLHFRPREPRVADPLPHRIALGYAALMLVAVTLFSIVEQQITSSISAYLLGIAAFSTLFYTTPRFSFWACGLSLVGLVAGSLWVHGADPTMWHHTFVALHATVIFWIGSRVVYSLKAANYLQLVTIEAQAGQLAASNRELARANLFKTDLLARAAHDLRDPLNSISLRAQTLRSELPAASGLQPLVNGIDDSARQLAEFVGNLLTDVAVETRQLELERAPTDLPRFVAETVGHLRPLADAKSIALHCSADASALEAPPASLDHAHFQRVIENLVTNAIKFSPPQRNVWTELSHQPDEGYRLVVRDEGPGLTCDDYPRLFQKYQRLSARPTCGETSTGLGLFIVHQLVTLHGGRVRAESDGPGRGSRFVVTLPPTVATPELQPR